jgi:uncharacterized membrane protein YtjA (UPF0391 family)
MAQNWSIFPGCADPSVGAAVLEPQRKPDHALEKESVMFYYTTVSSVGFFVIAIIAWIFGFGGIAVVAAEIARLLFFFILAIFLFSLIMGMVIRKRRP